MNTLNKFWSRYLTTAFVVSSLSLSVAAQQLSLLNRRHIELALHYFSDPLWRDTVMVFL